MVFLRLKYIPILSTRQIKIKSKTQEIYCRRRTPIVYHVVWQTPASFKQIRQQYRAYIVAHYKKANVLNGYSREPSTKIKKIYVDKELLTTCICESVYFYG